ncbi:MAG: phosphoribosylamine--glycine ligase [Alphaproteobacteria bacterium]|nr:phosphoribosylamine--glycine ligase [Alphaproteobacteria bacterium]
MGRILVLGSGGREHALCWKIAHSPQAETVFCAPGNAGTAQVARNVVLDILNATVLQDFVRKKAIDLVVIGPEAPLVAGIADALRTAGVLVFGPSAAAAQLEASKSFTRALCDEAGIPGACWRRCHDLATAQAVVQTWGAPIVVKADGLAAGKGVTVAASTEEAMTALREMMHDRSLGDAGALVVIEECLQGQEASLFVLCDGTTALPLALARDHKRIGEGDTGPNTGGMGCFMPIGDDEQIINDAMTRIIQPTLDCLKARGTPFQGVLFAGLILTATGSKLIEYNVRFGDPECQALMLRLESDLLPLLFAAARGALNQVAPPCWYDQAVINVVLAAPGYPGTYNKGLSLPETLPESIGVTMFHAGTTRDDSGQLRSSGGRVLNVCARGADITAARHSAYAAISEYGWAAGYYRHDIAGSDRF